ncbi:unnamed protein product [Acanthoscelides obtectus]|uniref:Uncharacterized protein n=1 Tax=Acanthoscelides obtectus TaxID=200917 RepID=A0A9P0PVP9_ACAOB|nr:unnamed protein product [Acanthoscelides obtectus]CAK1627037.1 hypothetical protein AOBTE_LOCUS4245 [Acanthoscelides obtectus]
MKMARKKNVKPKKRATSDQRQQRSQRQKKNQSKSSTKRKVSFSSAIKRIGKHVVAQKPTTFGEAILVALREAQNLKKGARKPPNRIVKIPKKGGVLPLIPIFAGYQPLELCLAVLLVLLRLSVMQTPRSSNYKNLNVIIK